MPFYPAVVPHPSFILELVLLVLFLLVSTLSVGLQFINLH